MSGTPARSSVASALVLVIVTLLMAGPNLPIPLLPGYRAELGMSTLGVAVVFGAYLLALVAVLFTVGPIARRTPPRPLLAYALAFLVLADVLLALGEHPAMLVAGRAATGVGVGLGVPAAAALLAWHGGPRADSAIAMTPFTGAVAGVGLTALAADHLPFPTVLPYAAHALLVLAAGAAVLLVPALRHPRRTDVRSTGGPLLREGSGGAFAVACVVGCLAWMVGGVVVAMGPTYASELLGASSRLEAAGPTLAFLTLGSVSQVLGGRGRPRLELLAALACMCLGLVGFAVAGALRETSLLFLACAIAGCGQGLGFRGGMAAAVVHASPGRHAMATSVFSGGAYAGAASMALITGALGAQVGLPTAIPYATTGFLATAALTALATVRLTPGGGGVGRRA